VLRKAAGWQFESALSVFADDDDLSSAGLDYLPWSSFLLNPRRLKGSDSLMRWSQGDIAPTTQVFQAPGGATTTKTIFNIYYQHGYDLGMSTAEPQLSPSRVEDKNGHVLPYVVFRGGELKLSEDALQVLESLSR